MKCLCGRETVSINACTPLGCDTIALCIACHRRVDLCTCFRAQTHKKAIES